VTTRRDRSCCCDAPSGNGTAVCCELHGENSTDKCTADSISLSLSLAGQVYSINDFGDQCTRCAFSWTISKTVVTLIRCDRPALCSCSGYLPAGTYSGSSDTVECYRAPRVARSVGNVAPRTSSEYNTGCSNLPTDCPSPPACQCCIDDPNDGRPCPPGGACTVSRDIRLIEPELTCESNGSCTDKRFYVTVWAYVGVCQDGYGCTAANNPTQSCGDTVWGISSTINPSPTVCRCNNVCSGSPCREDNLFHVGQYWTFRSEIVSSSACPPDVTKWSLSASSLDDAYGACNVY